MTGLKPIYNRKTKKYTIEVVRGADPILVHSGYFIYEDALYARDAILDGTLLSHWSAKQVNAVLAYLNGEIAGCEPYKRRIFVFGSNYTGQHGLGAALHALEQWGAVHGQAEGLQGDSYGIITKELRRGYPRVTLDIVKDGVEKFLKFAAEHDDMEFIVTPIGCGLAGFKVSQVAPLFKDRSKNVLLPDEFKKELEIN